MMTGIQDAAAAKLLPTLLGREGMGENSRNKRPRFYKAQLVSRALNEHTKLFCFFFLADNAIFKPHSIKLYIFVGEIT